MNATRRPGLAAATFALALAIGLAVALGACSPHVYGNGVYAEKAFDVPAFDRLSVGLNVQATVVSGAAARAVRLSGDENIVLQYARLEVVGSTLTLSASETISPIHPLKLTISVPELTWVEAIEGSSVRVSGLTGPTAAAFGVHAVEGSEVILSGTPPAGAALTLDLDTGASVDASGYQVASAALTLAAHAEALVDCTGPVTGTASGGSTVAVSGGGSCGLSLADTATCSALP
jgi:hypothetical protein